MMSDEHSIVSRLTTTVKEEIMRGPTTEFLHDVSEMRRIDGAYQGMMPKDPAVGDLWFGPNKDIFIFDGEQWLLVASIP